MTTTWTWVLGLGLAGCEPISKNGGEIHDTDSAPSDEGDAAAAVCNAEPVCGNGVVEPLEECDGGLDCEACSRTLGTDLLGGSDVIDAIAFAADGSFLAATHVEAGSPVVRRFGVDAVELWSQPLPGASYLSVDVALDMAGRAYFAGDMTEAAGDSESIVAFDPSGAAMWTFQDSDEEPSLYHAIAASGDRIAVVGQQGDDVLQTSVIRMLAPDGTEQSSLGDLSLESFIDATFVGTDLVVTGRRWIDGGLDQIELRRYDELYTARWTLDLPYDEAAAIHHYGVTGDGAQGTWVFGSYETRPYAARYDAAGTVLDVLDCFGPERGWVQSFAVDAQGRVGLGITLDLGDMPPTTDRAWFPIVQDGVVLSASTPTATARAVGVSWRADGLVMAWTPDESAHTSIELSP